MMAAAFFMDRDGVINHDTAYVHRPADFVFRDGIFRLCRAAAARGLVLVIATNQAGIGRGYYSEGDFQALTRWMLGRFAAAGVRFAAVEHCPDHPLAALGSYRRESVRRKPGPGMLLEAAARLGIDLPASLMLGDRATDMQAAVAAGVGLPLLWPADAAERAAAPSGTRLVPADGLHGLAARLERADWRDRLAGLPLA